MSENGSGMIEKSSPYILGIDLGTTNSSVSVYFRGAPLTISVDEAKSMPSVVQFRERKRDNLVVGKLAKRNILAAPDEVFSSVKRLMKGDEWRNEPDLIEKFTIDGTELEPVHIAAEILKALMEHVQQQDAFDLKGTARRAVICVPANTTDFYRQSVFRAAQLAGLGETDGENVILDVNGFPSGVWLLEEPTAAAIAYGHELGMYQDHREQTILVYDLGGGTFDVTILHVESKEGQSPTFSVKATKGVSKLGGDDFDREIMNICAEHFKNESGIDIFDLKSDQAGGTSGRALKEAQQKLKESAEEVKISFASGSQMEEVNLANFLKDGEGKTHNLEIEVRRDDFVERIQPLLEQAKSCITDVLTEANLILDDINRIIMVGGSSKADWVVDSIKSLYPSGEEKEPYRAKDVDVIVSQGAAIFGSSKPVDAEEAVDIRVEQIISHHLGIQLEDDSFGLILPKGLPLTEEQPTQMQTRIFGNPENQDTLQVVVWKTQKTMEFKEAEDDDDQWKPKDKSFIMERDEQENRVFECIGEFTLKGIPKAPRGQERTEVTMEINRDNLLKVNAKVLSTERENDIELTIDKS